ncbi:hypothetical protein GCM10011348_01150 [Marinobacterium nitratireducens]|uniref:Uncharacterized protein n=1 Tax=Marinobacterium nitratireducens TaxID=518897 RepID=A0A918DNN3_9GAMM|nr:hypothetical protein [Marinobacterium nitratireducens]GGO75710.1 hypothetical protein GCM10011348_01150 [Marinobacterium nitratireducens]
MKSCRNLLMALLVLLAMPVNAAGLEIEDFYGHYAGVADQNLDGEAEKRRLTVTIEPQDDNFLVDWSTRVRREDQSLKDQHYRVLFQSTRRGNVYASAMRINVFGKQIPLDPLAGDPFVWARIHGKTLTVYALMITDEGSYDMQVYDRELRDDGDLNLAFTRFLDGSMNRKITARLRRISD